MSRYSHALFLAAATLLPLSPAYAGCGQWGPERGKLEVWINSLAHMGAQDVILGAGEQGEILRQRNGKWSVLSGCTDKKLSKIRRIGDHYLAVGYGVILFSSDGAQWELVAKDQETLKDAASNGRTHLVVGNRGTLLMSTDGREWKSVSTPAFSRMEFEGAAWHGDRFYVAGYGGVILSSADGKEWQQIATGVKEDFKDIIGAGGRLVAVAKNGFVMSSTDGKQWNTYQAKTRNSFRGIAWSGKDYVAVGFDGLAVRSADGVAWQQWTVADEPTLVDVTWTGKRFVAAAKSHVVEMDLPRQ